VNRCHCRKRAPELPQGSRISHCGCDQRQVNWMFVQAVCADPGRKSPLRPTTAST
jgi:hypothetical protein